MRVATFAAYAVVLASCLVMPAVAWAQDSTTAPAANPELTAPVLQAFVDAPYPPEAEKIGLEADVVVQLDINKEGHVVQATVPTPVGNGFDEAAIQASQRFIFQPATRGGKPIPARILYRYSFTLKKAPPPAADASPAPKTILRGTLLIGSSTEPLAGIRVVVRPVTGGGAPIEVTTGSDGTWLLNDLPPGTYTVTVRAAGYQPVTTKEEVTSGEATEVSYRLASSNSTEVVVKGDRPPREVTKRTLERRELARIPGTNGDALRAIQNLPGVGRPPGLAGFLIVRGSAPQDTQVFIDGTLVPIAYHFGGLSSVVPTEIVNKIDFYPGNFSTQYGRGQGGIIDVNLRPASNDGKYHGLFQADFIDARAFAEGPVPIPGLKQWNFVIGARRSYVDVWLKPVLTGAGAGVTSAPVYYDYQLFAETRPTANSRLRIGVFGSNDRFEIILRDPIASDPAASGNLGFHQGFTRFQVLYRTEITDRLRLSTMSAVGLESFDFSLGSLYFNLKTYPISNRTELSQRIAKGVTVNVGQDILYTPFDIAIRAPPPPRPGEANPGPFTGRPPLVQKETGALYRPGAYAELELVPNDRLRLVPGFRVDYTKDTKTWDASPRVNGRYMVQPDFPKTTLKGGMGIFHQPPQPQETSRVFGSRSLRSTRAVHYSFGVEQEFTKHVELSVEGFYKQLDNLVSRVPSTNGSSGDYGNLGSGYVVGSEMLLRYKPDARFFGWIAYTLSRSMRRNSPDERLTLFQYDQTHIFTALGSYRLGRGWEFGARYRVVSGALDTPCVGGVYNSAAAAYGCINSAAYSQRLPLFHQLDLRVDKRWKFNGWQLSTYLDLWNSYNRQAPESISYNFNYSQSVYNTGLTIIPSLGVRGEF